MTTASRRRAVRAAFALGFLYIAALARAQVLVDPAKSPVTAANGTNYAFQNGTLQDSTGGSYNSALQIDTNFTGTVDALGHASTWTGLITGDDTTLLTLTDSGGGGSINLSGNNVGWNGVTAIVGGTGGGNLTVGIGTVNAFGTGSVSLSAATLQLQTAGTISNNMQLNGIANIIDANNNIATFSGSFFGTGGMTIQATGGGRLNLTGTSYYTGGTTVNSGLTVGLANSGFGSGSVSLLGANTIQLVGAANAPNAITFTGGATIDANQNSGTFSGPIGGTGNLALEDTTAATASAAGVITLSGAGSSWSGSTNIGDGTHFVTVALGAPNGLSQGGALNVNANATFNMSGYAQTINAAVSNNGTVMTGAGQLSANSYAGTASSLLGFFPVFNVASLVTTGAANLGNGTLYIEQRPATGNYTLVQAGTLSGTTFSANCPSGTSLVSNICVPTGYTAALNTSSTPGDLLLTLTAPSLILPGQTRNESAIAGGLNTANAASSADLSSVIANLNSLAFTSPAVFNAQLDELSPITYAALSGLSHAGTGAQMEAINRRVNALQAGLGGSTGDRVAVYGNPSSPYPGTLVAEGGSVPVPTPEAKVNPLDNPWGIYVSGLYATGRLDGKNGAAGSQPGYGFDSYGGMMGADYRFNDNFAAGFAAGYVAGKADLDGYGGQATSNSLLFGTYATVWSDNFHASGYLGTSMDSFSTSRNLPDFGRTATASPNGDDVKLDASGGWDIKEGRALLSPFFGLTYDRQHVNAFTEGGAGALDLDVQPLATNSLSSALGVKFSRKFTADWFAITPSFNAGWQHEFADQSRAITADFSGAGGSFAVNTADVSRDALLAGVALTMDMSESVSLRMGYSGEFRSDYNSKTADFSLRVRF